MGFDFLFVDDEMFIGVMENGTLLQAEWKQ